jgi:hypothetical protein
MRHKHDFETVNHPSLTRDGEALGIRAAQIRKCHICKKEETLILTKKGWVPLFEESELSTPDILMA